MKKAIKNVVFDQGKVLLDFSPEKIFSPYFSDPNDMALLHTLVFESKDWEKVDAGEMLEIEALDRWLKGAPEREGPWAKTDATAPAADFTATNRFFKVEVEMPYRAVAAKSRRA